MPSQTRVYELVLFGATGYTGVLTAEYIAKHLPTDLKWAVAGRSMTKLAGLIEKIREWNPDRLQPAVEVCGLQKDELDILTKKTKLIITTVGPFVLYGTPLVEACANNGTHYVDTTGEFPWTLQMIRRYHETAKTNGAIMIPQFGVESAAQDLLSWSLVSTIRDKLSVATKEVLFCVDDMNLIPSGGTLATVFSFFEQYSAKTMREAEQPWAHSPVAGTVTPNPAGMMGIRRDPILGTLGISAFTEDANRSVVHRSWGLMGNGSVYGPNFQYREYMKTSGVIAGNIPRLMNLIIQIVLAIAPIRWLLKKLVYAPGSGPDAEAQSKGTINFSAVGIADQGVASPARAVSKMAFKGGPYHLTGLFVAEAAITILREKTLASRLGGGFLTPAMLGQPMIDRLAKTSAAIETKVV